MAQIQPTSTLPESRPWVNLGVRLAELLGVTTGTTNLEAAGFLIRDALAALSGNDRLNVANIDDVRVFGTASSLASLNPVLQPGEIAFETDTGKWKIGFDGQTFNALGYQGAAGAVSATDLASTENAKGASLVGLEAVAGLVAATVQAAIAALAARPTPVELDGATEDLLATHHGSVLHFVDDTPPVLTIQAQADETYAANHWTEIISTDGVTITPDDGVTLNGDTDSIEIGPQPAGAKLYRKAEDSWLLRTGGGAGGDLVIGEDVQAWSAILDAVTAAFTTELQALVTGAVQAAALASTANGAGASMVGLEDAGGHYDEDDLETWMQAVAPAAPDVSNWEAAVSATDINPTWADLDTITAPLEVEVDSGKVYLDFDPEGDASFVFVTTMGVGVDAATVRIIQPTTGAQPFLRSKAWEYEIFNGDGEAKTITLATDDPDTLGTVADIYTPDGTAIALPTMREEVGASIVLQLKFTSDLKVLLLDAYDPQIPA